MRGGTRLCEETWYASEFTLQLFFARGSSGTLRDGNLGSIICVLCCNVLACKRK